MSPIPVRLSSHGRNGTGEAMLVPALLVTLGAVVLVAGSRKHWPGVLRHILRPSLGVRNISIITQHLNFFQQGVLDRQDMERVRRILQPRLLSGELLRAQMPFHPDSDFLISTRVLVESRSQEAIRILKRQLACLSSLPTTERDWFRLDLIRGLRELQCDDVFFTAVRYAREAVTELPRILLAIEAIRFPQFPMILCDPTSPEGQTALLLLHNTMRAIRIGMVSPRIYTALPIGDLILGLANDCPDIVDPRLIQLFVEALRHRNLTTQLVPAQSSDESLRHALRSQSHQLSEAEPILREYLHDIEQDLVSRLRHAPVEDHLPILEVIAELRVDAADPILEFLSMTDYPHLKAAIRCLQWSRDRRAGMMLRGLARNLSSSWAILSHPWSNEQRAELLCEVIIALRGHPGHETEELLLRLATRSSDAVRVAAIQSLGWWEPVERESVLHVVQHASLETNGMLRRAALGVRARLGERMILDALRHSLASEDVETVQDVLSLAAEEGLTWLWPDLDALTESPVPGIALRAWEALERLRESIFGPIAA